MHDFSCSRRQALGALAAGVAAIALPGCARSSVGGVRQASEFDVVTLLDSIGENLLARSPETATSLGLDTGARDYLRSRLADRSQLGQQQLAAMLQADLARIEAVDTGMLNHSTRTSVEVVRSAYRVALDGLALPYGDVAVGGWRNTPYVVIQNVGAYLDTPRFLDSEHPVRSVADAEAYLARLESMATQLDGELDRVRDAAGKGLIAPAFLIEKATAQLEQSLRGARAGDGLVESLVRRTREARIPGDWGPRAANIVRDRIAPALQRQLNELRSQRPRATMHAGMWAQPSGDQYYAWALRASTTTPMTADEVHRMGLEQLAELHGRMDPILRRLGYAQGSVGARMNALADDPRYKFSEGDKGRAEILAYIQEWLGKFRLLLPQAFRTMVRGKLEVKRLPPEEEPGAPGAYGGAGSIDGIDPRKILDQPRAPPTCTASTVCPTLPRTRRFRAMSGRANMPISCR